MNFIVAEAGHSYEEVAEQLDNFIYKQRAELVAEAEDLLPECF